MKKSIFILLLISGLVLSCGTGPKPPEASSKPDQELPSTPYEAKDNAEEAAAVSGGKPVEKVFDPNSISEEVYRTAKSEITVTIFELNWIIKARDYKAWVSHLADSYFSEISSREFLDERTEDLYRRDQIVAKNLGRDPNLVEKRILRTPMDYFNYVVVPSRANDSLDDISFLSEDRVRAYTIDERRGQRLVLYDLASINNKWLIVN